MIDFHLTIEDIENEAQLVHFVWFLALYGWLMLRTHCFMRADVKPEEHRWQRMLLWLGVLGLSVCCFTQGDFYHYAGYVYSYTPEEDVHLEPFYTALIDAVGGSYLIWRLVVWGMALVAFGLTAKRLDIPCEAAMYVLLVLFIPTFSYARASLAFAVYGLGLSFLIRPLDNKWMSYALAVALIAVCPLFHTSAYFLWGLTLCLMLPKTKKGVIVILCLFPILALAVQYAYGHSDVLIQKLSNDRIADSIAFYKYDYDSALGQGWAARVQHGLEFSVYYVAAVIAVVLLWQSDEDDRVGHSLRCLALLVLTNVLVSTAIFFAMEDMMVFYYRTIYMSLVPISLMVAGAHHKHALSPRWTYGILTIGVLSIVWHMSYGIYLANL